MNAPIRCDEWNRQSGGERRKWSSQRDIQDAVKTLWKINQEVINMDITMWTGHALNSSFLSDGRALWINHFPNTTSADSDEKET